VDIYIFCHVRSRNAFANIHLVRFFSNLLPSFTFFFHISNHKPSIIIQMLIELVTCNYLYFLFDVLLVDKKITSTLVAWNRLYSLLNFLWYIK
jgi:hypothetical protein